MPQQQETIQYQSLKCEVCSRKQKFSETTSLSGWICLDSVEKNNLRLFELKENTESYETFHIPEKQVLTFCDRNCATKYLTNSIDLFLSEVTYRKATNPNRQEL